MFSINLRNYVFRNDKRRLRDDRISLVIAFACSILALALGAPERTAAIAGGVVLAVAMSSFTVYFCGNAAQITADLRVVPSSREKMLYRPVSRRLATASAITLGASFSARGVAATVLDRRLQKEIQATPLDQASIEKVIQAMDDAHAFGIRLPSKTILNAQATLRMTSEVAPALSSEAIRAASAVASNSTIDIGLPPDFHGKIYDRLPEANGSKWRFQPIATNTGPDNYSTIGMARPPDVAEMERVDNPLPSTSEYGPAFLVAKDLTATLDGFHLKHVVFQDMKLIYSGGRLSLDSVFFLNCEIECRPSGNAWKLISTISKGGWASLTLGDGL
jgi:hypothetical protein